jgi:predicted MFS family arabinose efflux permease
MSNETKITAPHWTPARERMLMFTLAAIQFTTILDFVIILPLGPNFKDVFNIVEYQFGYIVSAYGIAAAVTGFAAGFILDRFDRKKALIWLYAGFTIGTLCCGLSNSYILLVASRALAGAFGGVVGAVILSIVGDVIPMERRGAAMGLVMSAFSISSIVGVPLGLMLANKFDWHVTFYALAGVSLIILGFAAWVTPALRGHLEHAREQHPIERTLAVMTHPDHRKAYVFMAGLTCAGFLVFPYIATYMVANVGLTKQQLPWIYLSGGLFTLVSMNLVGRWADRSGKLKVFTITSLSTAVPILLLTNLPVVSLPVAVACSTLLMICMSARMVPAMAMMTAAVEARDRGGFMSINSAVQQLAMGLTSIIGGQILGEGPNKSITHFPVNGIIAICCAYGCIYLARSLKAPRTAPVAAEPAVVEMS